MNARTAAKMFALAALTVIATAATGCMAPVEGTATEGETVGETSEAQTVEMTCTFIAGNRAAGGDYASITSSLPYDPTSTASDPTGNIKRFLTLINNQETLAGVSGNGGHPVNWYMTGTAGKWFARDVTYAYSKLASVDSSDATQWASTAPVYAGLYRCGYAWGDVPGGKPAGIYLPTYVEAYDPGGCTGKCT